MGISSRAGIENGRRKVTVERVEAFPKEEREKED